jgi:hypothetical protein
MDGEAKLLSDHILARDRGAMMAAPWSVFPLKGII